MSKFKIAHCQAHSREIRDPLKYLPLSLDDNFAVACLISSAILANEPKFLPLISISWALVLCNLYAMLFTRLDPVYGSGERIGLLIIVVLVAMLMLIWSMRLWLK